jgi:hypothetical protein
MAFRKIEAGLVQSSVDNFIGKKGTIFYDNDDGALRLSDGQTPGGNLLSGGAGGDYVLPTATTTTKGGVKVDGTTITINNQIISAVQQDLSSYATQTYVTTRGYLTSVGTISYNDLSNKPTLFSGSYTDLTDKPTIPSLTGYATETFVTTRGYLTSVGTISYNDLSNKPTLFSGNYNDLADKPNLAGTYQFSVAADDSTQRVISTDEVIKFVGAGGITTASDAEGNITITGSNSLTNTAYGVPVSATLDIYGNLVLPFGGIIGPFMGSTLFSNNDGGNAQLTSGQNAASVIAKADKTIQFVTNGDGLFSGNSWTLSTDGGLTFPDATTQTTAWTGVANYNNLTNKPTIPAAYTFNVAADDSTLRTISSEETVKFIGAGGITTASDAEGNITITQGVAAAGTLTGSTLASGVTTSSLTSVGTLTSLTVNSTSSTAVSITADGRPGSDTNNWSFVSNQSIGGPRAWIQFPDTTLQTTAWTGTAAAGTLTGTTLNSTVVSSSLTSVGTLTGLAVATTTTSNAATVTYNPSAVAGYAIQATGKDTQGGTGYFDFLRATNTTSGATTPSKTFRLNSTGGIEIINNAYTATLFTLTDAGALSVASTMSSSGFYVNNKQAVNGPAFRAYIDSSQTITSGSQQKVTFGTETFDTNANFASSRFTPTVEGYYQLNATVRISGSSGLGEIMLTIWKNGSEYARGTNEQGTEQGNNFYSMQVSDLAYANGSSDYFEIYIQQTTGGNRDTTAGSNISYFSGSMVRGA